MHIWCFRPDCIAYWNLCQKDGFRQVLWLFSIQYADDGRKQSTLSELRHISMILARVKPCRQHCLLQGLASLKLCVQNTDDIYDQSQRTLHEVYPFLRPPCGLIYRQCFQTRFDLLLCGHHVVLYTNLIYKQGTILVVLHAYLTLPTRLHRIFESVPKRWILSSFVVLFDPKCRWYMDASNLYCANCVTFWWFWHVLSPVRSITCYTT